MCHFVPLLVRLNLITWFRSLTTVKVSFIPFLMNK